VRLAGELDLASRRTVQRLLEEAASDSAEIILDLSRVTFLDVSGLRFLMTASLDARAASRPLIIRRPHRSVRRFIELTGTRPLLNLDCPYIGQALPAPSRDVVVICDTAIETAMRIGGADMANAQLLAPEARGLQIVAQYGFTRRFLDFFEVIDDNETACGTALNSGHPTWVPDITRSPIFAGTPALDVLLDAGVRAVASLPVRYPDGKLVGMISTHHNRRSGWTDARKLDLEQLAQSTGRHLHDIMPHPRRAS
jgi:anti-anti-sigma factor